jgi:sarcosine oxidase subunit alpha
VTIAALAGRATARNFRPMRLTPSHSWAQARGAVFVDAGLWRRSQHFPKPGETR